MFHYDEENLMHVDKWKRQLGGKEKIFVHCYHPSSNVAYYINIIVCAHYLCLCLHICNKLSICQTFDSLG